MGNETQIIESRLILILILVCMGILYAVVFKVFSLDIFEHLLASLCRMIVGYLMAMILGTMTALLMGLNHYIRMAFKPLLSFLMSIPTITWIPVLLILTGIGEKTIIIAIFLGAFFVIVYNTLEGLESVEPNMLKVGRMMEWSQWKIHLKISIPASFGSMLVGYKIGIAYAWRALIGAEMLAASQKGLGFILFSSRKFYQLDKMILALLIIGLMGYLINRILVCYLEEKTILKWRTG